MNGYWDVAREVFIPYYDVARPLDWQNIFPDHRPLQLEIGFGHGEYVLSCLAQDQGKNYIGIELDWGRIQKCVKRAARFPSDIQAIFKQQLRILHADAWVSLERFFRQKTIAHAVCLFPCPWPKDRHEHHRLFSQDFLRLLNSRLDDGGSLECVTDAQPYADWIMAQTNDTGFRVTRQTVAAQFGTKFERKWSAAGQKEFYQLILEKEHHLDIMVKEDAEVKAFYHRDFFPDVFEVKEECANGIAVVPKEWMFDPIQQKGFVRLIVSEQHLTQPLWIVIIKTHKGWCVARAEGQNVLPTPGTARAIELVSHAVAATSSIGQET